MEEKITEVHKLAEETAHTALYGCDLATQSKTIIDKKFKIISYHISNNDELINALRAEVYKLQSNLDDNINRSMKANLIFRGIPEDEAFSSYEETKELSNFIGSNLNIDGKSFTETIVRAHRSDGRPDQTKTAIRVIFL